MPDFGLVRGSQHLSIDALACRNKVVLDQKNPAAQLPGRVHIVLVLKELIELIGLIPGSPLIDFVSMLLDEGGVGGLKVLVGRQNGQLELD